MVKKRQNTTRKPKASTSKKFNWKTLLSKYWQKAKKLLLWLLIVFFSSTILVTIIYRFVPVYLTPLMVIRYAEKLFSGEKLVFKKEWRPIEECGHFPLAALAGEDAQFFDHHGFDFEAIGKAIKHNKNHKKIKGGSTISQQTAKNVFLWPSRTYLRKGLEAYFTVLIELIWSKERILEVYVNIVELGDGVYGAEAAAKRYYDKKAKNLAKTEAANIVAILPSPRKWSVKNPTNFVYRKQRWIRRNMDILAANKVLSIEKNK